MDNRPPDFRFMEDKDEITRLEDELAAWREAGAGMEWAGISYLAEPTCPYCEGVKPGNSKGYLSLEYTRAREGHKSDCKLAALLRRNDGD